LAIWQENEQKVSENGMKNEVENGYCETPGKQNEQKGVQNAFFMRFLGGKTQKGAQK
jgi:hypothetical protein